MSDHADVSDYNYFNVEDFSVDSFFRSLELQSKFSSSDLEFSFSSDLDNDTVPMSSVPYLNDNKPESEKAWSRVSTAKECMSEHASTETLIAVNSDDEHADAAVDSFFRSLRLRSCILRTHNQPVYDLPVCSQDEANDSDTKGLFSQQAVCEIGQKNDGERLSTGKSHVITGRPQLKCCSVSHHRHQCVPHTVPASVNCVSSASSCSKAEGVVQQTSTTTAASVHVELETAAGRHDMIIGDKQSHSNDSDVLKARKVNCSVCGVQLSSKYSYVRHLQSPLHRRRSEGYCGFTSRSCRALPDGEDIERLVGRQKPVQCRLCGFSGDTVTQLHSHLTSKSHYSQVRRRRLQCLSCRFVGNCADMSAHVVQCTSAADDSRKQCSDQRRLLVIAAYRRRNRSADDCKQTQPLPSSSSSCGFCGKVFRSSSSVQIHVRRRHTHERPFSCCVCSKRYCDNSTLQLHYRTLLHRDKCLKILQCHPT